ncbi:pentapeptide repeat protein [Leptolyngbya sp. NIES-3755]|nr:pentapeptide repeat protein [Leptolyngbya sp. NIES-3755]
MTQPQNTDAILGGQASLSTNSAILGGIDGLKARFKRVNLEHKQSILSEAIRYGEKGLDFLWQSLEDEDLRIRSHSYFLLKSAKIDAPELEMGIPLRIGDLLYGVYQSAVVYRGNYRYSINCLIDENGMYREEYPCYYFGKTANGKASEYISDAPEDNRLYSDDACNYPSFVGYFVDRDVAEEAAKVAFIDKFKQLECDIDDIVWNTVRNTNILSWWEALAPLDAMLLGRFEGRAWEDISYTLKALREKQRFDLLPGLWNEMGISPLAFVHEYVIDRNCYLRLSNHVRT